MRTTSSPARARKPKKHNNTGGTAKPSVTSSRVPALFGVFIVALVVRLIFFAEMHDEDLFRAVLGDSASYSEWGARIAGGAWVGDTVFYQAPMYPYFIGFVYTLFGQSTEAIRLVQILLGSVSCVLLALAGWRLFGRNAALVAGLGLAIYPPAIFFDAQIQKSVLDTLFLTAILAVLAHLIERPEGRWRWLLLGSLLGLLALTRENAIVLAIVLGAGTLFGFGKAALRQRAVWAATLAVGFAAILLPVAVRNQAVGGEFHLTTSQMGPNFYIGNHTGASGLYEPLRPGRGDAQFERTDATEIAEAALERRLTPGDVSDYWMERSFQDIGAAPTDWLALLGRKSLLLINRLEITDTEAIEVHADRSTLLGSMVPLLNFGILIPLALVGMVWAWPRRRSIGILYVMTGAYALSVIAFYIFARYRYPLTPMLLLFAAFGLSQIPGLVRSRNLKPRTLAGIGVFAFGLVLANLPLESAERGKAATYTNLGRSMAQTGDAAAALRYYELALASDPENCVIHNNLANQYTRVGMPQMALVHYYKALELCGEYAEAHNNLASLLTDMGRIREARGYYERALALNSAYPEAWANLGNLAASQGDLTEAASYYEKALSLDPAFNAVARNLAAVRELQSTQFETTN